VKLAAEVARRPAGTVTRACASSASREGAFRWLENNAVRREPIIEAMVEGTIGGCRQSKRVVVAVDGTSLSLNDRTGKKGLGVVGSWSSRRWTRAVTRGIHVMTALAISEAGCPIGICGQHMWVRDKSSSVRNHLRAAKTSKTGKRAFGCSF